mgnify:CR=1 FL=1
MTKKLKEAIASVRAGIMIEYSATMSNQYAHFFAAVQILVDYVDRKEKRRKV